MKIYKIMERKYIWFFISLAIIFAGLISAAINGLNWGIDFTGGTILHYNMGQTYELSEVRKTLTDLNIKDFEAKKAGDDGNELIIRTVVLSKDEQSKITESLKNKFSKIELIRAEKVDAVIGSELRKQAIVALIIANILMLAYISFRFQFISGIAAVLALIHDVLIVISWYALFRVPIDSSVIAVILTVVGYSINDTIVVFDRIRENLKNAKKVSFNEIANISIAQTLARSINTSLTTLLTIIALNLFGGETIKDFTMALIIGIVSGTYSSIFIASPLWSIWRKDAKTA
ncbi:protein translocase subunit SecF [Thermovenabulum gondwanense]|uniref:Protein-export membrane protein SecF n=1 Tax=Thermovenabulum gondwanense TaxID=520767 RepID=A0A161Q9C4_9FIRM|nr:protein translocase subunit SecF [Thermovenabulum gondwanense]KYO63970.1 hypothetical protein ATZ99_22130 [Thermovenabulum gondwanense]